MAKNSRSIRLLIVEDNSTDAELIVRKLRGSGFKPKIERVDTEEAFLAALKTKVELILCDYSMPQFSGLRALELLKQSGLDIPFIIVSGTIGEETAVAAMRNGAADYLLKDRLVRLGSAVEHALEQKRGRDQHRQAREAYEGLKHNYELILKSAGDGIYGVDLNGNIIFENPKAAELLGWDTDDLLSKPAHATIHHKKNDGSRFPVESCPIYASMRDGTTRRVTNDTFWRKDGSSFPVEYVSASMKGEDGRPIGAIVVFKDITEQIVAEMRLKLQAEQYRLLFETNPNPMWIFDTESLHILAVNEAAIAQYGYSREEFLKLTLKNLRPAEDVSELVKAISPSELPAHFSGEFRHRRKDGSLIDVEIYSGPIIWEGVRARIVTGIDITDHKRFEEELRSTHSYLRQLLAHTPAVIYSLCIENRVITPMFVSENIERLLGVTAEESARYEWWLESLHPDDRDRVLDVVANSWSGEGYSIDDRLRDKDGNYHWVEDNNRVLRDKSGQVTGAVGVWTDLTERKHTEERLLEQAEMLDHAHDAIIVRNFDDRKIKFWNRGAQRLYGWSAAEAIGQLMTMILANSEDLDSISKVLAANGEYRGVVKEVTKDGRELMVEVWSTLIRRSDGTPRSVLSINTDITEQKKLEAQLLRAQRLESIGTLASGVAHDLNNILTPILICSETLRATQNDEDRRRAVSLIEESARRGAGVVKQVLTFARGIEGERVTIKPSHLIEELVDIARKTFSKSIEITARYPEDVWLIEGDPTQLHQVLLNLAVNSRDAMPNGGSLVISAENIEVDENYAAMMPQAKVGRYLILQVSDTGTGIPRATIDKIFDPFFTTKEVGKGTGLGLSTAVGIVKSHGGFISVYSDPGKGTTFKVFLPAQISDEIYRKSEVLTGSLQGNGELILVVDDEPSILSVTKTILEKQKYQVVCAHDGPEALALFAPRMGSIKAVLSDIMLPHMDGVTLIRTIKKMKPEMVFIASTGQSEHSRDTELQTLGVRNFLTKPYDTGKLLKAVREALIEKSGNQ